MIDYTFLLVPPKMFLESRPIDKKSQFWLDFQVYKK